MKYRTLVLFIIMLAGIFLVNCHNPIMETWWDDGVQEYHEIFMDPEPIDPDQDEVIIVKLK